MSEKNLLSVEYKVTTITSTKKGAGTNGHFYYIILGSVGMTGEFEADHSDIDDRESGQTDTYIFTDDTDIGELRCVSIAIKTMGDDGWLFTEV